MAATLPPLKADSLKTQIVSLSLDQKAKETLRAQSAAPTTQLSNVNGVSGPGKGHSVG